MNIVKETRFVWCVVILFVVFAFAVRKTGDYDRDDKDFAHGESPPPPPPPPAGTACIPGFQYSAFGDVDNNFGDGNNPANDDWDSSLNPCFGGPTCPAGTYAATRTNVNNSPLGSNGNCNGGSSCSGPVSPALVLPSVTVPVLGSNLGACASCTLTPNNTYTTVSGSVTFPPGSYVIGTLTADIQVPVGPVTLYVTNTLTPGWTQSTPPNATLNPANLLIFGGPSLASVNLSNHGGYFALYAPNTNCTFSGTQEIYGALVCRTITAAAGAQALHYDKALAGVGGGGFQCASTEISRSSPIVATVGSGQTAVVQGTFARPTASPSSITDLASVASWSFPYIKGHMRARLASSITSSASSFSSGTIVFDAGATGSIPPVTNSGCGTYNGACRNIFTTTATPNAAGLAWHPTQVQLNDGNAATIGSLIVPNALIPGITGSLAGVPYYQTIVRKILNAKLGGVDRSTVAVIGPSTVAGNAARPTIAYFGATDGMLHAVCASAGGTTASQPSPVCPTTVVGTELWAFLPRSQLPRLDGNTQRIDGSIRVVDVFGDFTTATADGTRSWHTILTFQAGSGISNKSATYALDVTDPALPVVLWEYTTPVSPATLDTGAGLTVAAGQTLINGSLKSIAVVETNNGGTGTAGVVTTAIQMETGAKLWQFGYQYPSSPRGVGTDGPLPTTGIVGGAVGVDLVGSGYLTDVAFGDLYGNLWRLDITTGISRNPGSSTVVLNGTSTTTTGPLFSFAATATPPDNGNKHPFGAPPAIYAKSSNPLTQYAVLVSGGYDDPTATAWTQNVQYLIGAKLNSTAATVTQTTAASTSGPLSFNQTITAGDKGFSQALVVGNNIFVTSDSADVSSATYGSGSQSGHLMTLNTSTGGVVVTTSGSGAGSLASNGSPATLYGSAGTQQSVITTGVVTTGGGTVDTAQTPKITRNLWLRTQ